MRRSSEEDWEDDSYDAYGEDFRTEHDEDSDDDTILCPSCGASMYEDSPRCPACGEFPSREQLAPTRPPWILLTGFLCLLIVLSWFLM